ncbi:MAG: glycosyl transferase [Gammaproteobacteria bacterium]
MTQKTVICMKWGTDLYNAEYINRLYRGVKRHLSPPFNFVCFTDNADDVDAGIDARDLQMLSFEPAVTGMARKLALMHPKANLHGTCLFLDLDIVITGNLDDFFTYPGKFCIIHNWIERRKQIFRRRPLNGNSSVYRFVAGAHPQALEKHLANPEVRPNQAFLTRAVGLENITWWPEEWVRSFKRHAHPVYPLNKFLAPKIPPGCRILAFHGKPNPDDAIAGINCGGYKHSLPMPELAQYWR